MRHQHPVDLCGNALLVTMLMIFFGFLRQLAPDFAHLDIESNALAIGVIAVYYSEEFKK
jgi:hypothetical protein